jgi:hypothetical protein
MLTLKKIKNKKRERKSSKVIIVSYTKKEIALFMEGNQLFGWKIARIKAIIVSRFT